ncbi:MAG: class I SAM-dependent methyltransferase [Anaerolineae bacterium]|nr:methyltransferase domain-containing protein [Chloroflexota bacterium]
MIWLWLALVLVVGLVMYWLLVITEGTYLGTGAVIRMYDWTARRYNAIKKLQPVYETYFLGVPLAERLRDVRHPRVLDVAAGTGRLMQTLLEGASSPATVTSVDHSLPMLRQAQQLPVATRNCTAFIQGDAQHLMFRDFAFDAVTCLEALEFMWDPRAAIVEMLRVLRPGGTLLLTNRIGWEAWFFPGRYTRRGRLEALLSDMGLTQIQSQRWQVYYDLVWAVKPPSQEQTQTRRRA